MRRIEWCIWNWKLMNFKGWKKSPKFVLKTALLTLKNRKKSGSRDMEMKCFTKLESSMRRIHWYIDMCQNIYWKHRKLAWKWSKNEWFHCHAQLSTNSPICEVKQRWAWLVLRFKVKSMSRNHDTEQKFFTQGFWRSLNTMAWSVFV